MEFVCAFVFLKEALPFFPYTTINRWS